ncbi:cob(I)alamin adenosyltransferase [Angomonas deanei]|nr:cob(I)alamin adenosyltransferase [Angomonas deanei]EPY42938.1 cob(I)alamin adenosyltransferase [Angomonas deanei]|eukprot:EPY35153.1 cob(I)alamin adenosyltransferase [Angomonas deanei]
MDFIESIQQELLNVGTVIATPTPYSPDVKEIISRYQLAERTQEMEKYIDEMDSTLAPQRLFILPGGGNSQSAQLHVCRTTCRRAERRMIEVRDQYEEQYDDYLRQATVYVNRMSDFLFVAARSVAEEDIVRTYK